MTKHDKFLSVCRKLWNRYSDDQGKVMIIENGKPSKYRTYENLAAVKYLGCDPDKLPTN